MTTSTSNDSSLNMMKWGACTRLAKSQSIRTALSILWSAWTIHNSYRNVEAWCLQAFDWKKEELVNKMGPLFLAELRASSHPNNLTDEAAESILLQLVPNMPPLAITLLERLKHLPLTVCYLDENLSEANVKERVFEISHFVKTFLNLVRGVAQKYISQTTKRKTSKLKLAKKSFKRARKLSFKYKSVVEETRKDLILTETKIRGRRLGRSRFESNDSEESNRIPIKEGCEQIELTELGNGLTYERRDSLPEEDLYSKTVQDTSNLLAEDSQRSVGIVNPVHTNCEEENMSDDSIKEEMRSRLYSNASAEKTVQNLQENLTHCQAHIDKLREDMKNFRDKVSPFTLQVEEGISRVLESIQATANMNDEAALDTASEYIDTVRHSNIGKCIHRIRQAFQSLILKRYMAIDMWRWLCDYVYDRIQVHYASPLRIIHKYTSARCTFKQILPLTIGSKFLMIVGPIGSGKTYLVKYLLCKWVRKSCDVNCPFDYDAVIPISSSYFSSNLLLEDYVAECLTTNSSTELLEKISSPVVKQMRLLFIAEIDTSSDVKRIKDFIEEMNSFNLGSNAIITCRNENAKSIETLIVDQGKKAEILHMLCLDEPLLLKFVQFHNNSEDICSRDFCSIYESLNLESNLRQPLFVLLSMYLYKRGLRFLSEATCLSRLVLTSMVDFHLRASEYHKQKFNVAIEQSNCWADDNVKALNECIWQENLIGSKREELEGLIEIRSPSCEPQELFHPFLIFVDEHCYLAHPAFRELLSGVHLAGMLCRKRTVCLSCCANLQVDGVNIDNMKLSTECLIVAAGIWSLTETMYQNVANRLASLYAPCAVGSPIQWLKFVQETGQSRKICLAVATQLKWKTSWNASTYALEENIAISELLRIEAYYPKKVIISDTSSGTVELVSALAICPSVCVILRNERHFYNWNNSNFSDDLVELLQPAGNLVELWAHLDTRGAYAIRHMKKLQELNVRISSVDALLALANILPKLTLLKAISLRVNIPHTISVSAFPSFAEFKGQFWIRLLSITDDNSDWAIEVVKRLHNRPTDVHLHESTLTPDTLQHFKKSIGTNHVSISM